MVKEATGLGDRFGAWRSAVGLDVKLGLRMMGRYPMLTIVGGIAIAVATAVGIGATEFILDLVAPKLPLHEGDRIVRVYQNDTESGGLAPASFYDMEVWRESVTSIDDLGAYATMEQGVRSDRGEVGTVSLARMSASGFRVTRVPPLMGRYLLEGDERPEASPVAVLGYTAWQDLLGGDPAAVGRTIEVAGTPTEVVGVMPEGYAFPESQNAWVPFGAEPADLQPETARRAMLFGRLAPGATLETAQAELEIAGQRAAADYPELYRRLSPQVVDFAQRGPAVMVSLMLAAVRLLFIFLLLVICVNVATLVFARTVVREGEIAVRTALGASRRRIVLQLVAETVVLVGVATLVGMAIASYALPRISRLFFTIQQSPQPPFWWDDGLSPTTIVYTGVLTLVGALMIGAVPALKATSGKVRNRLGEMSTGGGGALRFGGMWTVIIVLQVALSVAFLPLAVSQADAAFDAAARSAFPAEEYVTAQLGRDPLEVPRTPEERTAFLEESRLLFDEVKTRLAANSAVDGVALASGLSAMNHLGLPDVEFIGDAGAQPVSGGARVLLVDPSYLELMGATVVAGQPMGPGDFNPQSRSILVNEQFVETVLGGRNPVGGQLRFPERDGEAAIVEVLPPGTTADVVGVVRDPGIDAFGPGTHSVIYAPLDLAPTNPRASGFVGMPQPPATQLFVRMRPEAGGLGNALYETVASVDPSLRLSEVGTAAEAWGPVHTGARIGAWIFMALAGIVLMLSVAGIYALMSFTVSRRTREIAIRNAIGAPRRQIVRSIFGRAALQLLVGVALGGVIAVPTLMNSLGDNGPRTLIIVSVVLLAAGLVACLVPVRRALAIEPAVAMKAQ